MKFIALTQNKSAIVNDRDYKLVSGFKWYASKGERTFYAHRQIKVDGKKKTIHMHKVILGTESQVDHKNRNGLDNRRRNLRVCTGKQNCMNVPPKHNNKTSKYKGVYRTKNDSFEVQIKIHYKSFNIGRTWNEKQAAKFYDAVARFYHGDFAWCNFKTIFIAPISKEEAKRRLKIEKLSK